MEMDPRTLSSSCGKSRWDEWKETGRDGGRDRKHAVFGISREALGHAFRP